MIQNTIDGFVDYICNICSKLIDRHEHELYTGRCEQCATKAKEDYYE